DFSAYRYLALQDIISSAKVTSNNNNTLTANNYLTRNNVICFELISKCNSYWILHYEALCKAEVDVSNNLPKMIQQHFCSLNEYFYTSFYAISHFYCIWRSGHSRFFQQALINNGFTKPPSYSYNYSDFRYEFNGKGYSSSANFNNNTWCNCDYYNDGTRICN
ncbi:23266_t:CDS:2, partial [Dentiscutata erythropus]